MEAFVPPNYCYILKSNKMKIELKTVVISLVRWKMAKIDLVHEARKLESKKE